LLKKSAILDYFTKIENRRNTSNKRVLLKLPMARTEFAKKSTHSMAAKTYNFTSFENYNIENFIVIL